MSERNDTLVDRLRALGFVLAVVLGGLIIAGVLDGLNERADETEAGAPASEQPLDAADD